MIDEIDLEDSAALLESLNELANQFRNSGWVPLDGLEGDTGLDLDHRKEDSAQLQDMTETNPLVKRGAQLRYGYTFGRGLAGGKTRYANKYIDTPVSKDTMYTYKAKYD